MLSHGYGPNFTGIYVFVSSPTTREDHIIVQIYIQITQKTYIKYIN